MPLTHAVKFDGLQPEFLKLVQRKDVVVRVLENSKVLVTGAGGFLGSHIIPALLAARAEVVGLDLRSGLENGSLKQVKSKVELAEIDIADSSQVEKTDIKCDYLVHLAAIAAPALCEKNPDKALGKLHGRAGGRFYEELPSKET